MLALVSANRRNRELHIRRTAATIPAGVFDSVRASGDPAPIERTRAPSGPATRTMPAPAPHPDRLPRPSPTRCPVPAGPPAPAPRKESRVSSTATTRIFLRPDPQVVPPAPHPDAKARRRRSRGSGSVVLRLVLPESSLESYLEHDDDELHVTNGRWLHCRTAPEKRVVASAWSGRARLCAGAPAPHPSDVVRRAA